MPLDRLVLILIVVIAAAGLTVGIGLWVLSAFEFPGIAGLVAVPFMLLAYILWRLVYERLTNNENRRYDDIEH
ncbi:hypothetical protein [Qingshengfaniella alkalisoli]|uniref:Uncharacterized protein n=1 Tax=Qingshengfaniella alkalisoli TaxID=2599296 RepID=A0A5B8IWI5_9RHOB|nr:hypothetical protein [Qingshengfaniella alkalisoli]QDY69191.1 hypothetical protein FPZ52_05785 [Qingshengfaniella alkalisoli]